MDEGPRAVTASFADVGPIHWVPLFAVAREVLARNTGGHEQNLLSLSYGRIVRKDINANDGLLPDSFDGYQVVEPGDSVLRLTDLQNDQRSLRTGFVRERGIITSAYLGLRPDGVDPRFLAYALYAADVNKVFYAMGGGLRQSIKFDDLKRLPIPLPESAEQRRIADFLDDQVTRIDRIIGARTQQADGVAAAQVAWLTDRYDRLVADFGAVPLRRGLSTIGQGWSPQCDDRAPSLDEWGVLRAGAVNGGVFRADDAKALPAEVAPRMEYLVREGDLLVNRASGSLDLLGSAAIVGTDVRPRTLLCDKIYGLCSTIGSEPSLSRRCGTPTPSASSFD